jgi:hypothetical protein
MIFILETISSLKDYKGQNLEPIWETGSDIKIVKKE